MKKLTVEEAADLNPIRKGRTTWMLKELAKLKIGEAIFIANADWKSKLPPYRTIRNAERLFNMTFDYGRMPDDTGWLAKRTK